MLEKWAWLAQILVCSKFPCLFCRRGSMKELKICRMYVTTKKVRWRWLSIELLVYYNGMFSSLTLLSLLPFLVDIWQHKSAKLSEMGNGLLLASEVTILFRVSSRSMTPCFMLLMGRSEGLFCLYHFHWRYLSLNFLSAVVWLNFVSWIAWSREWWIMTWVSWLVSSFDLIYCASFVNEVMQLYYLNI
jgi:hypothetical protein